MTEGDPSAQLCLLPSQKSCRIISLSRKSSIMFINTRQACKPVLRLRSCSPRSFMDKYPGGALQIWRKATQTCIVASDLSSPVAAFLLANVIRFASFSRRLSQWNCSCSFISLRVKHSSRKPGEGLLLLSTVWQPFLPMPFPGNHPSPPDSFKQSCIQCQHPSLGS